MAGARIPEFESYMPSHAVGSRRRGCDRAVSVMLLPDPPTSFLNFESKLMTTPITSAPTIARGHRNSEACWRKWKAWAKLEEVP